MYKTVFHVPSALSTTDSSLCANDGVANIKHDTHMTLMLVVGGVLVNIHDSKHYVGESGSVARESRGRCNCPKVTSRGRLGIEFIGTP